MSATVTSIAIHPERVASHPSIIRWVVPAGTLPTGLPVRFPPSLAQYFTDRVLTAGLVEDSAVWLWIHPEQSWAAHGSAIREALIEALATPNQWVIEPCDDAVLRHVVQDVLDGPVGDVIRSHGGDAALSSVNGNVVEVEFSGACSHCPAISFTLHNRLEKEIRARHPQLECVVSA